MSSNELETFLKQYPSYKKTEALDKLRKTDYFRLDAGEHVYLDYTGGGIYAESQIQKHHKLLNENVYGNPHSSNPTSLAATELVEGTREYILKFFNADPNEYLAIFTSNASSALKLVGESYPFPNGRYLLTFDNHNSVNGIREFAHARGAEVTYIPVMLPEMRVDASQLDLELARPSKNGYNLFAYPAQSNFSSVKHPLEWIEKAHAHGWDVLLDAAAYVPTNKLDLSKVKPDFVPISFYKIFGYPTGLGALIARKSALSKLHRPWFAGGTITVASVQGDKYYLADGAPAFEDGTLDYLNIPAIEIGLKHIESIGYDSISERVRTLTGWLLQNLTTMKHSNGEPLVRLFGPATSEGRGGAVTVNFYDKNGKAFDHRFIESEANKVNISLRTGCFCNPGAGEVALGISRVELDVCFTSPDHKDKMSIDDFRLCIDGKSSGAVRISVGMVTNFNDVQAFLTFARGLLS
ncbi:aminotransferase class V-fold PLP-dependent enzyme [Candidatus Villigracilis affinis]|jgi:selenocysteine lyase/cysteine desulfurase|uniref:aminotransferase class V-fold PLP-dependent enzyme n=1 Tax=Candidatus Villigracilis affinis TaxID=3140682 RepID=UPI002A213032|nr:aminotransferase class V-fold PLP-dependent enzyme [Anaerolineales bacterium]